MTNSTNADLPEPYGPINAQALGDPSTNIVEDIW